MLYSNIATMDGLEEFNLSSEDEIKVTELYWEEIGDPDYSPNFLRDYIAGLRQAGKISTLPAPRSLPSSTGDYDTNTEYGPNEAKFPTQDLFYQSPAEGPHFPGVNDFMSGAVHPRNNAVNSSNIPQLQQMHQGDRTTVSEQNWDALITQMPHKVLSRRWISHAFSNPDTTSLLDKRFYTTVSGFHRALKEAEQINGLGYDAALLIAVTKRGGLLREGESRAIVYPEGLVPILKEDDLKYDREYWEEIARLRDDDSDDDGEGELAETGQV